MSARGTLAPGAGSWRNGGAGALSEPGAVSGLARSRIVQTVLWGFFALTIITSIYGVRLMVAGFPVRSIFAILGLAATIAVDRSLIQVTLREHPRTLITIAAFALLGTFVSLANGASPALIGRQLLEIHLQAAMGLFLVKGLVRVCGVKVVAWTFIVVVGVSAAVAAAQFLGINAAWQARKALGVPQGDGPLTQVYYLRRDRAMGLSYSPVHLGTQTCLAFVAFYALRLYEPISKLQKIDYAIVAAAFVAAAACFVSGNRSPLLGVMAFSLIYFYLKAPKVFWVVAPIALACIPVAMAGLQMLAQSGARVASTDDGSALGRIVLSSYGWRLFTDRPIGYGLGFDSISYSGDYWEYFEYFANAQAIRTYSVHNFFLQILDKYGVGALLAGLLVIPRRKADFRILLPFTAYIVHISFHNDGPMQGDFLIWYVLAMFPAAAPTLSKVLPSLGWRDGDKLGGRWRASLENQRATRAAPDDAPPTGAPSGGPVDP